MVRVSPRCMITCWLGQPPVRWPQPPHTSSLWCNQYSEIGGNLRHQSLLQLLSNPFYHCPFEVRRLFKGTETGPARREILSVDILNRLRAEGAHLHSLCSDLFYFSVLYYRSLIWALLSHNHTLCSPAAQVRVELSYYATNVIDWQIVPFYGVSSAAIGCCNSESCLVDITGNFYPWHFPLTHTANYYFLLIKNK